MSQIKPRPITDSDIAHFSPEVQAILKRPQPGPEEMARLMRQGGEMSERFQQALYRIWAEQDRIRREDNEKRQPPASPDDE